MELCVRRKKQSENTYNELDNRDDIQWYSQTNRLESCSAEKECLMRSWRQEMEREKCSLRKKSHKKKTVQERMNKTEHLQTHHRAYAVIKINFTDVVKLN